MEKEIEKKYENFIHKIYANYRNGKYATLIDPYFLVKKGVPEHVIASIIADMDGFNSIDEIFPEKTFRALLKEKSTRVKAIDFFNKNIHHFSFNNYVQLILNIDLDLYFITNTIQDFSFNTYSRLKSLMTLIKNKYENFNSPQVKKFLMYFYDDEKNGNGHLNYYADELLEVYFEDFDLFLKQFFILKLNLVNYLSYDRLPRLLNIINQVKDDQHLELLKRTIKEIKNLFTYGIKEDGSIEGIVELYNNVGDDIKSLIYKDDEEFFKKIGKSLIKWSKSYHCDSWISQFKLLTDEQKENIFKYYPNLIKNLIDSNYFNVGCLVVLKLDTNLPENITKEIELPMTQTVLYDGSDVHSFLKSYRDNSNEYVRYYVDDELWEETEHWDYHHTEIPFDEISEENINKIKDYFKKNDIEYDEDDLDSAMKEDGEISNILSIAAQDGQRFGDQKELSKDIRDVLDELFGSGNWEIVNGGLRTTISLIDMSTSEIFDAFYWSCDQEWDISCIWRAVMTNKDSSDKPSLPEYRYGIQGDFDVDVFNDYISDNIN